MQCGDGGAHGTPKSLGGREKKNKEERGINPGHGSVYKCMQTIGFKLWNSSLASSMCYHPSSGGATEVRQRIPKMGNEASYTGPEPSCNIVTMSLQ